MLNPKVSICIPAYKQVEYLKKTLDSILIQNFTDFEVILTDDSPNNDVQDLVKGYDFKGKLQYFKNDIPLGTPENWNEGIRKATGEYIKIMHHDDWFDQTDSLGKFVQLLDENKGADLAFCCTKILNVKTNEFTYNNPSEDKIAAMSKDPSSLFFNNYIGAPSATIFRRSVNILPDTRMKYVVDIDLYMRILNRNNNLAYSPTPLIVNVSNWEEQVTHDSLNKKTQVGEYSLLYNKHRKSFLPSRKYLEFFRSLFIKYNIKSLQEFKSFHAEQPKPAFVFSLLIQYLKLKGRYE